MDLSFLPHSLSAVIRPITRAFATACACVSGVLMLGGCANIVGVAEHSGLRFTADSSLLGPESSTTYVVTGSVKGSDEEAGLHSQSNDASEDVSPTLAPAAWGTLVMSDGMITSVELVASVDSEIDIRFILTEPALFERRGEMLESIRAVGTLSTDSGMYPDTSVTLVPEVTAEGTYVEASFDVPESLTSDAVHTLTPVLLKLRLEPLATFENSRADGAQRDPRNPQEIPDDSQEARPGSATTGSEEFPSP